MNGTQNLNIDQQNLEQCLKTTSSIGKTIYHNICTGATYTIPMGGFDWMLSIFLIILGIAIILAILNVALNW